MAPQLFNQVNVIAEYLLYILLPDKQPITYNHTVSMLKNIRSDIKIKLISFDFEPLNIKSK